MYPLRVAFAGLAHSHPFTDASNMMTLRQSGAKVELVGVTDSDKRKAASFADSFGCPVSASIDALANTKPDLVIATPRPEEIVPYDTTLLRRTNAQLFFNKTVAATQMQFNQWCGAVEAVPGRVSTASVLRFAPKIAELAKRVETASVWGIRVLVQHDIQMFLEEDRKWQDDPENGGGTLVTLGVHAWEMINRVFPVAVADSHVAGWMSLPEKSISCSEEVASLNGVLRLARGEPIPYNVMVTGVPGPEVYGLEVFTSEGLQSSHLDFPNPDISIGYMELASELLYRTSRGEGVAPWDSAKTVVGNTIRIAQALRGNRHIEKRQRHV